MFCRWNQLDVAIVLLSVAGIILEEMKSGVIPINPTIIRVMRVLRIARGNTATVIIKDLAGACERSGERPLGPVIPIIIIIILL